MRVEGSMYKLEIQGDLGIGVAQNYLSNNSFEMVSPQCELSPDQGSEGCPCNELLMYACDIKYTLHSVSSECNIKYTEQCEQ